MAFKRYLKKPIRLEHSEKESSSSPNSPFSSSNLMLPKNGAKSSKKKKHVNWTGRSPIHIPSPHHQADITPPEPKCFPICRWFLILIGMMMLISVLFIMGQLLLDWGNGRAGGPAIRTTESSIFNNSTTESLIIQSIINSSTITNQPSVDTVTSEPN